MQRSALGRPGHFAVNRRNFLEVRRILREHVAAQ